ncbi:hypothetical protein [Actinacidiphila bryophytorum]|uniref:Uncharacterized protein n=1 Tax=Actinacidiphila bryophytorum TaxID=1436133 RepID=A0A9W4MHB0_9ACTN|nr:hypothetical protein [Actinacidiphila bryophytorum]MBN6541521.1 hypothetical protein [Actinacidiphila bryophytorum]CAG7643386.1 conserved hypothetical protein [Actinacidiphila bryophytorum]
MTDNARSDTTEGWWDGPWYRVRTDRFVASFLPSAGEDLDAVCNVDVEVRLTDGSRWSATVFTVAEVQRLMERWAQTGEEAGGRYFWCSDGLIVREAGVVNMAEAISGALDEGDFEQILQRLDNG